VLHDAYKKALDDPEFQKMLDKYDQDVFYMNSADYTAFVKKAIEEEQKAVRKLGLKL
jgi:tripartite-type tricarboxylate transporter receptor subunit TctC